MVTKKVLGYFIRLNYLLKIKNYKKIKNKLKELWYYLYYLLNFLKFYIKIIKYYK